MLVTNFWQVIIQVFSTSDYRFYKKAKQVAKISDFKKVHIGCVAVYQGKIIGIGCNTNKTHPLQKYYNKYREEDVNNIIENNIVEFKNVYKREESQYALVK